MSDLHTFFAAKHFADLPANDAAHALQVGRRIQAITETNPDWSEAEIVIIGCGESSGSTQNTAWSNAPDAVREELYRLYDWHSDIKVADMGNILQGATPADTRAALRTVLREVQEAGKVAIAIGGTHDLTLQQYDVFKKTEQTINAAVIDMLIDLEDAEGISEDSYLMDMLTGQPNFIRHYSHIGFQSYYANPNMLETLDKLRFDCYRLGHVRADMDDMEPVLRNCDLLSIDMNVLRACDAPWNSGASPNGFFGDELCQLIRYAGMATHLSSLGIYGYRPEKDKHRLGAKQIAQMLWYFIDGYLVRKKEAKVEQAEDFTEYHVSLNKSDTIFLKSRRTNRWWMQLPDGRYAPCSYNDYLTAAANDIPERWFREQERVV
ncbi:MAG: formimidoylglutamase [Edaphocola sp.]